jgi:hypothetical protein
MYHFDEELILATLFERVKEVNWQRPGDAKHVHRFITSSRRVKLFSDVSSTQQPACYQAEHGTTEMQVTGMPYKTVLEANWIIYQCVAKDAKAIGAIENNLIIQAVRVALDPRPVDVGFPDKRNTLGQLVYHCFVSGRIFKDPGDIDGQGMLVIPIKLLVP